MSILIIGITQSLCISLDNFSIPRKAKMGHKVTDLDLHQGGTSCPTLILTKNQEADVSRVMTSLTKFLGVFRQHIRKNVLLILPLLLFWIAMLSKSPFSFSAQQDKEP